VNNVLIGPDMLMYMEQEMLVYKEESKGNIG